MPKTYTFSLEPWQFTLIQDGFSALKLRTFFTTINPEISENLRSDFNIEDEEVPVSINILLADDGQRKILVDTGLGRDIGNGEGRLLESLLGLGLQPQAVNAVILTHGHWDHIGAVADDAGRLCFPSARHFMPQGEWDFWTSEKNLEEVGDPNASWARENLPALAGRVETISGESEILPGVRMLPAPGHTLAQMGVLFIGKNASLLHAADAFHHPFQIRFPEISPVVDLQPNISPATRDHLLKKASLENLYFLASHFPFPGLGTVHRSEGRFHWAAVDGPTLPD